MAERVLSAEEIRRLGENPDDVINSVEFSGPGGTFVIVQVRC